MEWLHLFSSHCQYVLDTIVWVTYSNDRTFLSAYDVKVAGNQYNKIAYQGEVRIQIESSMK